MAGSVIKPLTHISLQDPLIFIVLNLESTLGISEPGAKSCYICWVLTDAHLRQETSQHKALSRGHLTLFLLLWTQPCLSPLLPLAFSCLRPLAAVLGQEGVGEGGEASGQTADNNRGGGCLLHRGRAAGGKASGSWRETAISPLQPACHPAA